MHSGVVPCGQNTAYLAPQGCTSTNAQNRFPDHMFGVDNTSNSLEWPSINMLACSDHREVDVTMWIALCIAPGALPRGASAVPAVDNTSNSLGWPSINMLACSDHREVDVTMWIALCIAPSAWRRGPKPHPASTPRIDSQITCVESTTPQTRWDGQV